MQTIIDGATNYLYVNVVSLPGHVSGKEYSLKFSKRNCQHFYFVAQTEDCDCRVRFEFCIKNYLNESGEWTVNIFENTMPADDRTKVHSIIVSVNK